MKIANYFFVALLALLIFSCENQNETANQVQKSDTLINPVQPLAGYSEKFKFLIKSEEGIFRGINLGRTSAEVKIAEEGSELDEQGEDYIDYMVKFTELESAEV